MRSVSGSTIYIDGISLTSDPAKNYAYLYNIAAKRSPFSGRKIKINLGKNISAKGLDETDEFYVPEDFEIDPGDGGGSGTPGGPATNREVIYTGKLFQWNADTNNINGVVIILEYDPTNLANLSFANSYPQRIRTAVTVTDNGSYNFTSTDLTGLPIGASITVTAGRGNFQTITDENNQQTYSIYAYTIAEGFYLLQ